MINGDKELTMNSGKRGFRIQSDLHVTPNLLVILSHHNGNRPKRGLTEPTLPMFLQMGKQEATKPTGYKVQVIE